MPRVHTAPAPAVSGVDGERLVAPTPRASPARRRGRRGGWTPYALLTPALIVLAALSAWPLLQLVIMSFQEFGRAQVFGAPAEFIGAGNYVAVLTDPEFWRVLSRSLAFAAVCVVLTMVLGVLVALLMRRLGTALRTLVSVGLLLAWAMPPLSATIVWGWIFDTQYGVLNHILSRWLGLPFEGHSWLLAPESFFLVATVIIVWGAVPFVAFTVYAGLTQVPDEVMEAAQLDGAGSTQRFLLVVMPYLRPLLTIVTILQVIWDLRVFTQIYSLQSIGGIADQTNTLGVYIYRVSLGSGDFGVGGAISVLVVLLLVALSAFYVRRTVKEETL
ncbi:MULTISPECIES: carbohydrate ABC transporter permease [Microbacterium]|uniref:Sugar ABC transporter permease n=1 Tax=Microbacterium wangchenii TaxID=2541726 RepID=A0ABX5SP99_9MICO|nr:MULTISPECIES: sugar ABC transporter permease [Microbacterium]MCK6066634.1 sugar ABC transporter permease [Microbacterium sp. EYE_512]QBR87968.1 sugar ABC transporter permease [Microbacterium wangchenii]TFV83909.1 sugar ABC transporter permease [Microbacterium sp. dk485]TXK18242.1 sugar ABC transporter permease [Microbacterium wangchenii]